ncbi:MAG: hypothetical protein FJ006_06855 [Chloroflexi bacterium]|nr:hypothetical protein [Chloroflexota bacterium]
MSKEKVERPYRWLQDRIVRTCVIEKIIAIDDVHAVLKEELNRYNNHQVHSTAGEVPGIGFDKARKVGIVSLGLLSYPSRILRLRKSFAYERNEWSTDTESSLYLTTKYRCHAYRCEMKSRYIWFLI